MCSCESARLCVVNSVVVIKKLCVGKSSSRETLVPGLVRVRAMIPETLGGKAQYNLSMCPLSFSLYMCVYVSWGQCLCEHVGPKRKAHSLTCKWGGSDPCYRHSARCWPGVGLLILLVACPASPLARRGLSRLYADTEPQQRRDELRQQQGCQQIFISILSGYSVYHIIHRGARN